MNARLTLEHVESRSGEGAGLQRRRQRRVVDDAAARDVGQRRGRLHQAQLGGTDRVVRGSRVGQHQHQVIGLAQQRRLVDVAGAQSGFGRGVEPGAVVIDHRHAEAQCAAPRDGLADAAHAQDAQRCAMHVGAGKLVEDAALVPEAGAHEALGLAQSPRGRHHQREAQIRRCLGQHIGCVGHQHAAHGAGLDVDVVVADADIAHGLDRGAGVEQRGVDALAAVAHHAVLAVQALLQFVRAPDRVVRVVVDLEMRAQALRDVGESGAGDQDGFHDVRRLTCPRCACTGRGSRCPGRRCSLGRRLCRRCRP